jgi:hypothetical protein
LTQTSLAGTSSEIDLDVAVGIVLGTRNNWDASTALASMPDKGFDRSLDNFTSHGGARLELGGVGADALLVIGWPLCLGCASSAGDENIVLELFVIAWKLCK